MRVQLQHLHVADQEEFLRQLLEGHAVPMDEPGTGGRSTAGVQGVIQATISGSSTRVELSS